MARKPRRQRGHVRERSPGRWEVRLSLGKDASGKWRTATITIEGNREDAEAKLEQFKRDQRDGVEVRSGRQTVAEFLDNWLTHARTQVSPKTHERYTELVKKNIVPLLGAKQIKRLTDTDITAAYATALASGRRDGRGGLSAKTVIYMHRILKQALNHAGRWPRAWDNKVKPPKADRKRMTVYSGDQITSLIEAARTTCLFIPVLLGVTNGLRRGEVAALRWRHIDLDRARISVEESAEQTRAGVRYKPPKNGKGRTVDLPGVVVDELRAHRARQAEELFRLGIRLSDDSFVVAQADGSPYQPRSLTHAFEMFLAKYKLPHIRLHDLRHSHATALLQGGVHPKIVQERLGHSTIAITLDIYSHVIEGMQRQAADVVDAALRQSLEKRRS